MVLNKVRSIWMICVLLFIGSCAAQNHRQVINGENILMELELDISEHIGIDQKAIPILIGMTNSSTSSYKVSSVKYWSNIALQLKKGNELVYGIKVKPDLSKRNEYLLLEAGQKVKEEFNFHLDEIYRDLSKGFYVIEATFIGHILDNNERAVEPVSEIKAIAEFTVK